MIDPNKPIRPEMHGLADYGMSAIFLLAPSVLGLRGTARVLCYLFAVSHGTFNAVTDHPLAYRRIIPFKVHGQLEKYSAPMFLGLPRLLGATRTFRGSAFFNLMFLLLVGVYNLTAWDADPNEGDPRGHARQALESVEHAVTSR